MQRENISALMDGELLDSALIHNLSRDKSLQKTWQSYHLVRDVLRSDTSDIIHSDIASRVMAAISDESISDKVTPLITEAQPTPQQWRNTAWWQRLHALGGQAGQIAVAACVALAVIVSVQHYRTDTDTTAESETPVFNTLPMMGQASPVSLGVPSVGIPASNQQLKQDQYRRAGALLQDYELQRRLHSEQLQPGALPKIVTMTDNPPAGTRSR